MKALARLELIAPAHLDSEFAFEFIEPAHLPNPLLKLDEVDLGYGDISIVKNVSLSIESGARIGLLGVNGSGKSTLIKTIAGELTPLAGQIIRAEKLNVGYFAQHQLETLRSDQSPIWHIQQLSPQVREQEIRNFLGGFQFQGEMAMQAIAPFSGGEKARLALAMIVWQQPNLLLLDEPTNHLDLDMRHALTVALQSFQGALIVVSHDRSLLEATTDGFVFMHEQRLHHFDGDLNDYRQWRLQQDQLANQSNPNAAPSSSQNRKDSKRQQAQLRQQLSQQTKPLQKKIASAEATMAKLGTEQQELEAFLGTEDAYSAENKAQMQQSVSRLGEIKTQLATLEEDWLMWQDEVEQLSASIQAEFGE